MEDVIRLLKERRDFLGGLKTEKEKALAAAPEGILRVNCRKNSTQYYRREDSRDANGVYIREQNLQTARDLAQKDYDQKVLQAAEKEIGVIQRFLTAYPMVIAEKIYETLHKERQKLVEPVWKSEEAYLQRWKAVSYEGKGIAENMPEFYTTCGERVRSKSENLILTWETKRRPACGPP